MTALESVRQEGQVNVHILEQGSLAAIHEALHREPYHILHLSCHAAPGYLILEDDNGNSDWVSAERFFTTALSANQSPSLILLAGCATGVPGKQIEAGQLPGLAQELVRRGVPAVLGMQATVTDRYATDFTAQFFAALVTSGQPDPFRALATARREVENERRINQEFIRFFPEWSTPTLHAVSPVFQVPDLSASISSELVASLRELQSESTQNKAFIGRRRELRLILQALRSATNTGAVIFGIGGVGKSSLANLIVNRLIASGWFAISISGNISVDNILAAFGHQLQSVIPPELTLDLHDRKLPWQLRFEKLAQVLETFELILFLDDFETQLDSTGHICNKDLFHFITYWIERPGRSHLLITTRQPLMLSKTLRSNLLELHLPPLSLAETRKLFWRLPALRHYSVEELRHIYEQIGGHPGALKHLNDTLESESSSTGQQTDLDLVIVKVNEVTAQATDISSLFAELSPIAIKLLIGAAVYRLPVDIQGLTIQVQELDSEWIKEVFEHPISMIQPTSLQGYRPSDAFFFNSVARSKSEDSFPGNIASSSFSDILSIDLDAAKQSLEKHGLLVSLSPGVGGLSQQGPERYFVHRWLANTILRDISDTVKVETNLRAYAYWNLQIQTISFLPSFMILLEQRYHAKEANRFDAAIDISRQLCIQLHTWGKWKWEESICRETIEWLPDRSEAVVSFVHQLGLIAQEQGHYDDALAWYNQSLNHSIETENQTAIAAALHQLATLSMTQGKLKEARERYEAVLALKNNLANQAPLGSTYHQLGILAEMRGAFDEAYRWYHNSLEIKEYFDDTAGKAMTLHQL